MVQVVELAVHVVTKKALIFQDPEHALLSLSLTGTASIIASPSHPPTTSSGTAQPEAAGVAAVEWK